MLAVQGWEIRDSGEIKAGDWKTNAKLNARSWRALRCDRIRGNEWREWQKKPTFLADGSGEGTWLADRTHFCAL
jgi:hypothetical protein